MPAAVLAEEGNYPNPPVPAIPRTLRLGDSGQEVKVLQMKLNKVGANLLVDGQFGPRTDQAVRTFQTVKNITPDGVVGPETWAALG
jgi:peptidoglycan hydrolase-like protein with peptidoglycan-binding domain